MYFEHQASPILRRFVECYWYRTSTGDPSETSHRVLPDGCIDIVFSFCGTWHREWNNRKRVQRNGYLVGTMTKPFVVWSSGTNEFFGVRFRPGMASVFFKFYARDLTDFDVEIDSFPGPFKELRERIENTSDPIGRIRLMDRELLQLLTIGEEPDRRIEAAVNLIQNSNGTMEIDRVCNEIGITRQHLSRRFHQFVGITPKMFSRIIRFRSLLTTVHLQRSPEWASEAGVHGYYDQSHLIADFLEFAGMTPSQFVNR